MQRIGHLDCASVRWLGAARLTSTAEQGRGATVAAPRPYSSCLSSVAREA